MGRVRRPPRAGPTAAPRYQPALPGTGHRCPTVSRYSSDVRRAGTVIALALALAVGACGDGDDTSAGSPASSTTTASGATTTTLSPVKPVDYATPGEPESLGDGLVEAATPDGSAFYVLDEDPAFSEPGCEGQPEPVMSLVPLDGGSRVRLGTAGEAVTGRLVPGPGDRVALVDECEGFLQEVRVGTETADGRLEGLRVVPLDTGDASPLAEPRITAWNAAGDALLAGGRNAARDRGTVARIDPATGAVTRLFDTAEGGGPGQVAQLADGTYVVAESGEVSLRSASGEITGRTPGAGFTLFADAGRVAVFGETVTVLAPGSEPKILVPVQPDRSVDLAAVSPDGAVVAYAYRIGEESFINVIDIVRPAIRVVESGDALGRPTFSGDGRALAFSRFDRAEPFGTEVLVARFGKG